MEPARDTELNHICLCHQRSNNVVYIFNKKNQNTIAIGSICFKRFRFQDVYVQNQLLLCVLKNTITSGDYEVMNHVFEFNTPIIDQLSALIHRRFEQSRQHKEQRRKLLGEIKSLMDSYDMNGLEDIFRKYQAESDILDSTNEETTQQGVSTESTVTAPPKRKRVIYYTNYTYGYPYSEGVMRKKDN